MSIPFTVPTVFSSGLADGSLLRFGALLKDAGTGRIVGHLQETGVLQQVVHASGGSLFSPLNTVLTAGSSVYTSIQIQQLTAMVSTLRTLQYANLSVGLVGIGVGVASLIMLTRRLKEIERTLLSLRAEVLQQFQDSFNREFRAQCARVECLLDQARVANTLSNSSPALCDLAAELADARSGFAAEVKYYLDQDRIDDSALKALAGWMMLCDSARVECLLLADELEAAKLTSEQVAASYRRCFDQVDPLMLTDRIRNMESTSYRAGYTHIAEIKQKRALPLLVGLREATDAASTKPLLIQSLIDQDILGSTYLERVRGEREHSILVLQSDRSESKK